MKLILLFVCLPSFVLSLNSIICDYKTKSVSCQSGFALQIRSVNFGRTSSRICRSSTTVNCYSSGRVTAQIAQACNNKDVCQLTASPVALGEDPCKNVPKYLDIQYDCDPVPTTTTTTTTTTTPSPTVKPLSGHQVCHQHLVSGPNGVRDTQIQVSTRFTNGSRNDFGPARGRLHTPTIDYHNGTVLGGGWSAALNDKSQFIQVELNKVSTVRGVVTQGRNVDLITHCCNERVTKFTVSYSIDGVKYEPVKDPQGNKQVFTGNVKDQESVVTNMLGCPIIAKFVRIHPVDWLSHISMRFDLIGCPTDSDPLGKCPKGWEERPGTDDCYIITSKKMKSWMEARQDCLNNQGDLVKIDSVAEKQWLILRLKQIQHSRFQANQLYQVWIGLNNRPRKDSLKYVWTDGTPHDPTLIPWKKTNPDNFAGQEHCGEFVNSELNDVNCFAPLPYVCEKKKFWSPPANTIYNNNINSNNHNSNNPNHVNGGSGCPNTGTGSVTPSGSGHNGGLVTPPAILIPTTIKQVAPTKKPGSSYPCPVGGQCKTIGNNFFTNGCGNGTDICTNKGLGDHQSCKGCHWYLTCAPSGVFTRPCPVQLKFDDNLKACVGISSTCRGP